MVACFSAWCPWLCCVVVTSRSLLTTQHSWRPCLSQSVLQASSTCDINFPNGNDPSRYYKNDSRFVVRLYACLEKKIVVVQLCNNSYMCLCFNRCLFCCPFSSFSSVYSCCWCLWRLMLTRCYGASSWFCLGSQSTCWESCGETNPGPSLAL